MASIGNCLMFFPRSWGFWVWGRNTTELKFPSHPIIKGVYFQHSITIGVVDLPTEVVYTSILHCKSILFPPFRAVFGSKSLCMTGIQGGSYVPPPWGLTICINHLEYFCMRHLSTVLNYVYSTICLYRYELMVIYFMIWVIIEYYIVNFVS